MISSLQNDTLKVRLQVQGEVSVKGEAAMQPRGVVSTHHFHLHLHHHLHFHLHHHFHHHRHLHHVHNLHNEKHSQLGTLVSIVRNEGATALYSGIVPGLQRQMAFSAIRSDDDDDNDGNDGNDGNADFKFSFQDWSVRTGEASVCRQFWAN